MRTISGLVYPGFGNLYGFVWHHRGNVDERRTFNTLLAAALPALVGACSGGGGPAPSETDAAANAAIGCTADARAFDYEPGLEQPGESGLLSFRLVSAEPAPPAKGQNSWLLELFDGDGAGVGAAEIEATPFMPDHGHGSTQIPSVSVADESYDLSPIVFFMPGLWRVRLDAQTDLGDDAAEFFFCIEG
jgi:hypothetical protein